MAYGNGSIVMGGGGKVVSPNGEKTSRQNKPEINDSITFLENDKHFLDSNLNLAEMNHNGLQNVRTFLNHAMNVCSIVKDTTNFDIPYRPFIQFNKDQLSNDINSILATLKTNFPGPVNNIKNSDIKNKIASLLVDNGEDSVNNLIVIITFIHIYTYFIRISKVFSNIFN